MSHPTPRSVAELDILLRHYDEELARLRRRMAQLEAEREQVRRELRAQLVRPVAGDKA